MSLSYNKDDENLQATMEANLSPPESPVLKAHNATKYFHSSLSDDNDPATNKR